MKNGLQESKRRTPSAAFSRREQSMPKPLKAHQFQILLTLADRPVHGYGIRHEVLERTDGTVNLWPGVLYRTLSGLEESSLIEECRAPDDAPTDARQRVYYRLTDEGREALSDEVARMESYVATARARAGTSGHA
jgi:DNA-binding PadR family transcriptional regulator